VLNFDSASAVEAALLSSALHKLGRSVDVRDILIAGIVAARHGTLATRNQRHFLESGIAIVNPWDSSP
jgi:predicted nucleic acid-binding protein